MENKLFWMAVLTMKNDKLVILGFKKLKDGRNGTVNYEYRNDKEICIVSFKPDKTYDVYLANGMTVTMSIHNAITEQCIKMGWI